MLTRHLNRLDVIFDGLRLETRGDHGALVTMEQLYARVVFTGINQAMLQEGVKNWISLGIMHQREDGRVGWTIEGRGYRERSRSPPVARRSEMLASSLRHCRLPMPDDARGRPIALLSLFDGLGTARLAVDEILRMEGAAVRLVGAW